MRRIKSAGVVMEYVERSLSEIRTIDNEGITFNDGESIVFKACIGRKYNSETCVAESGYMCYAAIF